MSSELDFSEPQVLNKYTGDVINARMVEELARLLFWDYQKIAGRCRGLHWEACGQQTKDEFRGYARAILERQPFNPKR